MEANSTVEIKISGISQRLQLFFYIASHFIRLKWFQRLYHKHRQITSSWFSSFLG